MSQRKEESQRKERERVSLSLSLSERSSSENGRQDSNARLELPVQTRHLDMNYGRSVIANDIGQDLLGRNRQQRRFFGIRSLRELFSLRESLIFVPNELFGVNDSLVIRFFS